MKLILAKIGKQQTVTFAFDELKKYLKKMDPELFLDCRRYDRLDPALSGVIWVGLDGSVERSDRDRVVLKVKDGAGIITGSGERAVLLAVYRFLTELGCRFLHPGAEGEVIPSKDLEKEDLNVELDETASYRHRSVCIEGAVGHEHVYNMIDWLPKVGMNGYFVQFHTPSEFFHRFYSKNTNPNFHFDPISSEDVAHIWNELEEEIIKRGLDYHATGHGWTCEPFGIRGGGWTKTEESAPEEVQPYLAEIGGVRNFWKGVALNTNLCYSRRDVRDKMNNAIVEYCKSHPAVNFLHFWLADGTNNHCECEECAKMRPSDYYVQILNELDEKLTAAGLDTKIVCLIYVDLLWEPEKNKIQNPDRFVLMFAPITRTYSRSFTDFDDAAVESLALPPYVRNHLTMPRSVEENVARLKRWKKDQLSGDSFDFDYHLMWDHFNDPGYYECARILHKDMAGLEKIGLDGMVSCQIQRCSFPTGLPIYSMAKALWNKNSRFEDVCKEYFTAAFGEDAEAVENYLATLSQLFDPVYMRGDREKNHPAQIEKCREAKKVIEAFREAYILKKADSSTPWKHLKYHATLCLAFADAYVVYLETEDEDTRNAARDKAMEVAYEIEPHVHSVFDAQIFKRVFPRSLKKL